jgi:hypothetical protein
MNIANFKSNLRRRRSVTLSLVVCVAISVFAGTPGLAQGEPERQFVLEGLDGVHIIVPAVTGIDVDRSDIARAVEERINSSGMKVIGESEYLNNTSVKSLVVKIIPLKSGGKTFYSLNLDLTQMIYLSDKQSRKVDVSMWDDVTVGFVDKGTKFKEDVLKRVDNFIDMWRRANGKVAPRS